MLEFLIKDKKNKGTMGAYFLKEDELIKNIVGCYKVNDIEVYLMKQNCSKEKLILSAKVDGEGYIKKFDLVDAKRIKIFSFDEYRRRQEMVSIFKTMQ